MKVITNFTADLCDQARRLLAADGVGLPVAMPAHEVLHALFDRRRRCIVAVPRQVLRSRELVIPAAHRGGFAALERAIQTGAELWPYLSRQAKNPHVPTTVASRWKAHDMLLNDWNIHHLHLGLVGADGWAGRTDELLFAIFQPQHALLLQVLQHGDWTHRALMEILRANWPQMLIRLALHGAPTPMSPEKHEQARRGGVMAPFQFDDGELVLPRGGGYSTRCSSVVAMDEGIDCLQAASQWEEELAADADQLVSEATARGLTLPDELPLTLTAREDGRLVAQNPTVPIRILLSSPPPGHPIEALFPRPNAAMTSQP